MNGFRGYHTDYLGRRGANCRKLFLHHMRKIMEDTVFRVQAVQALRLKVSWRKILGERSRFAHVLVSLRGKLEVLGCTACYVKRSVHNKASHRRRSKALPSSKLAWNLHGSRYRPVNKEGQYSLKGSCCFNTTYRF